MVRRDTCACGRQIDARNQSGVCRPCTGKRTFSALGKLMAAKRKRRRYSTVSMASPLTKWRKRAAALFDQLMMGRT